MINTLKTLPLHEQHVAAGAKMAPFAGYHMPLQYQAGILKEHLHTRQQVSLFDVSHMGQLWLQGDQAAETLERLMPMSIQGLKVNRQRYALLTNEQGGIIDDLIVTRLAEGFFIVVNAACFEQDWHYLQQHCQGLSLTHWAHRSLIALQGPKASELLQHYLPAVATWPFLSGQRVDLLGYDCIVTRSGYTGEDGFELSIPADGVADLVATLCQHPAVAWAGLGARDSLRLEAGLCLYGQDIDQQTTPVEAGLAWAIQKIRRHDGKRAGGFPGEQQILAQLQQAPDRYRVGLLPQSKVPVRQGAPLLTVDGERVGHVTSGAFSPSLQRPIAMGYVNTPWHETGQALLAEVRGKTHPIQVAPLPFVPHHYYRP